MDLLRAWLLCVTMHGAFAADAKRCPAPALAAVQAADEFAVDARLLLAIGFAESRWRPLCRANGANGAWQVMGVPCRQVRTLRAAARAGAERLAWWQARARARRRHPERAVAAYACGFRGLNGDGCTWYVAKVGRIMRGTR